MSLTLRDRIYAQYRKKPKALAWYDIIPTIAQEMDLAIDAVTGSYDIDNNEGEQLNVIGRIVNIDRSIIGDVPLPVYELNAEELYEAGDEEVMLSATSVAENQQLSDDWFRILIRAKIARNSSDVTIESILDVVNFILPTASAVQIIDPEDMTFYINYDGLISDLERNVLLTKGVIPKPQGVNFNGYLESYNIVEAGDDSIEVGDENAQLVGYIGGE